MTASPAKAVTDTARQQFERQLRSYIGRRLSDGAAADLVRDILLRLVRSRDKLSNARNPTARGYRVAANAITDYRRKTVPGMPPGISANRCAPADCSSSCVP